MSWPSGSAPIPRPSRTSMVCAAPWPTRSPTSRGGLMPKGKLAEYERKRDFSTTREPSGKAKRKGKAKRSHPRFAFQKHSATSEHYDLRLEVDGVLAEGSYGAGPMIVWDRGVFENISETRRGEPMELADAIKKGDVKIFMLGEKIKGAYALVRTGPPSDREKWLLIKKRDEGSDARRRPTSSQPESVLSGRTIEQVLAEEAEPGQFQRHRARRGRARRLV